ncbi:MAG: methionyl-tRNA formyltransferase [Patescibacteria group bacterium]
MEQLNKLKWIFFGTSKFSVIILDELKKYGIMPMLVVTTEDKPQGRKLVLTPPPVKIWAESNKIPFLQLKTLRTDEAFQEIKKTSGDNIDLTVVASYGKIIPKNILDIPEHGTINVHPSLLPKLRGASPIESAILSEKETGVTIIKLDEEMDHGPILAQEKTVDIEENNPPYADDLEQKLAKKSVEILIPVFEKIINRTIEPLEQNHSLATFCQKLDKKDALVNLSDDPVVNIKKVRAYQHLNPHFFDLNNKNKRVVIRKASIQNGVFTIEKVTPEGGKEIAHQDYLNGIH